MDTPVAEPENFAPSRRNRRDAIIEHALDMFAEAGFEQTTMADVAADMNIGAPALYYYFSSKRTLLFACLEKTMEELNTTLERVVAQAKDDTADPVETLRRIVEAQVRAEISGAERMLFVNGYLYGAARNTVGFEAGEIETLRRLQRTTVALYRQSVEAGISARLLSVDDATTAAFAVLGMVQYVSSWYRPDRGAMDIDTLARRQSRLALQALGCRVAIGSDDVN